MSFKIQEDDSRIDFGLNYLKKMSRKKRLPKKPMTDKLIRVMNHPKIGDQIANRTIIKVGKDTVLIEKKTHTEINKNSWVNWCKQNG
jgi:hypothetical protein